MRAESPRFPLALLVACCALLSGCRGVEGAIIGYEYWPLTSGTLDLVDSSGDVVRALTIADVESDCRGITHAIMVAQPAEWSDGPGVRCKGKGGPLADFYPWPPGTTTVDWPSESGTYPGNFYLGEGRTAIDYHVNIEEDRGELTPLPANRRMTSLEATSSDYYRRFRITAEVNCEDSDLPCEGTWKLDVVYEQPRDRVWWLYTTEE